MQQDRQTPAGRTSSIITCGSRVSLTASLKGIRPGCLLHVHQDDCEECWWAAMEEARRDSAIPKEAILEEKPSVPKQLRTSRVVSDACEIRAEPMRASCD
jgi:hypothetical protein